MRRECVAAILLLALRFTETGGRRRMGKAEGSFCHPFPAIVFERNKIGRAENGSLVHDGLVYPADSYRVDGGETYGCACDLRACLKKCCERNEILGPTDRPNCTRLPPGLSPRDPILGQHQLATEIRAISRLTDRFVLVEDMACPENTFKYMLEPERYEEDAFVLQANGTLRTLANMFPAWSYCLDWKESFEKIVAIVCLSADASIEQLEEQQDSFKVGAIVSIPFFFATFFVYAIIPELRNLYGKTVMCYVACLLLAYTFLVLANLFYFERIFCTTIALYDSASLTLLERTPDRQRFLPITRDPCGNRQRYKLIPSEYPEDAFMLLDNGSIYKQNARDMISDTEYCFGIVDTDAFDVILCFDADEQLDGEEDPQEMTVVFPVGLIVSVPFLFATFLVYAVLPELRNMHGRTLRGYVGSLLLAYVMLAVVQISPQDRISDSLCIAFAFIIHFSFLASFFWLNVMCFDIWWTFGGFRSLQGSVKQRERKKFLIYSVYAWGCASLLTGLCVLMDFLPDIPEHFVKPEFGEQSCWFTTDKAKAIYFYGPMGVTVLCNICLFVSTALKILRHKKDTAHQLRGIDSRRHDDNKQWFNLYLKLFIVMGINWSMEIVSWLCNNSPAYIWYLTDLANTLQGVIIFLIFVWKEKIRRLLAKRFGCRESNVLSRNSTRSGCHSSTAFRTCTTSATAGLPPPREKTGVARYPNDSTSFHRQTPSSFSLNLIHRPRESGFPRRDEGPGSTRTSPMNI